MCACVHVLMCACVHVCMCACVHVRMCACAHVCMCACVHVCMCACVHVCMCACVHVCMCACVHVCMCACVHVRMCACVHVRTCAGITLYTSHHYPAIGIYDPSMVQMTGYRNKFNPAVITDTDTTTCDQVTTPASDTDFILTVEIQTTLDSLTVTAVLDECLDFPATMVYTEGDQSALLPYHNNPSFCDNAPGHCVFKCDCSDTRCRNVFLVILADPKRARKLCEIYIT